jgi:hypothetical protein
MGRANVDRGLKVAGFWTTNAINLRHRSRAFYLPPARSATAGDWIRDGVADGTPTGTRLDEFHSLMSRSPSWHCHRAKLKRTPPLALARPGE